jgi:hypothetical protein
METTSIDDIVSGGCAGFGSQEASTLGEGIKTKAIMQ